MLPGQARAGTRNSTARAASGDPPRSGGVAPIARAQLGPGGAAASGVSQSDLANVQGLVSALQTQSAGQIATLQGAIPALHGHSRSQSAAALERT
jgi:hypothetical protein